ncbi:MAG: hypothetical protein ACRC5T_10600, partial [Cetobacterium sp.]
MTDYTIPTKAKLPHLNQEYFSNWDEHPIIGQIGGWVCDKDTGDLKYKLDRLDWNKKLDGTDSVLTGEDGDVMVKIPAFYCKATLNTYGKIDWELDDTVPNLDGTNGKAGFKVHPAFIKKDGK